MIPRVSLREALSDPNLLGTAIAGDSWRSWRVLLIAAMGEELREDEREIFTQLTGREREPLQRIDQFAAVIGRRGGKSKAIATLATYIASRADLVKRSTDLFNVVKSGKVKIETTKKYKLADAAQAHRDLEGRQTTGSVVLIP